MKRRVLTIVGTRPEIIRLSSLIKLIDEYFDHRFIHTGQNSSTELKDVFFRDLELREPDAYHSTEEPSGLGRQLGGIFSFVDGEIEKFKPEAIIVLGDTNSGLSALLGKRQGVTVYHLEAGNRSFDENVPEEVNRRVIDHFADFNLVYNQRSFQHLVSEGISPRRIMISGSPMAEVIQAVRPRLKTSLVLTDLKLTSNGFLLASLHRQENVDDPKRLTKLLESLAEASLFFNKPVLVSEHPRTRSRLEMLKSSGLDTSRFIFHRPFGYLDYLSLQMEAFATISDSGTVAEESYILGFPAVTPRDSMERPESMDAGSLILTGLGANDLISGILMSKNNAYTEKIDSYEVKDFSQRVAKFILSTLGRSRKWNGLH